MQLLKKKHWDQWSSKGEKILRKYMVSKPHSNGYLVGVWVREGDGLAPAALPSVFPTVDSLPIAILRNFYKGIKNKPQKQMIGVLVLIGR